MKPSWKAWICAIPFVTATLCLAADVTVLVIGDRVNLRSRPDSNAEVIGQVSDGDRLTARSVQGDWVEVAAPGKVEAWVHRDLIAQGTVRVKRLNIRGGPGINYREIGTLTRGDPVETLGEFGEWIRIAPPPSASVWISREFIKPLKPAAPPTPTVAPPSRPAPLPAPPAASLPPPPPPSLPGGADATLSAPADLALAPVAGQGRQVQREGVIRGVRGLFTKKPTRFQLVRETDGASLPLCYLHEVHVSLTDHETDRVRVRGREYIVQGFRLPVLVVDECIPESR